jgi:TonB-dependent starch-binding outer membrane protein SusC
MKKMLVTLFTVFLLMAAIGQNKTISGKVTDDKGNPISSASVQLKGTNIGTTTKPDGTYSLSVPANARKLVISSVGSKKMEFDITGSSVNAKLDADDPSLEEVVVVGYSSIKKKDVTGNSARIGKELIADRPVQSFDQALGGKAPGLQINIPNGVINAPPVIRVRGINSISLSSVPLFVIDGVPTFTGDQAGSSSAFNPLSAINPNDIENIEIAKDAAATAVYGSRGANGVIFVTTKKGAKGGGKAKVNIDSWIGWTSPFGLPQMLDAFQYTEMKNRALQNAGLFSATNQFRLTTGPDGNPINTNWFDVVYRTGMQRSNTVSISGGNEATQYYMSINQTNQEGILKRNDFKRLGVLLNVDHKINKAISLGGKLQYSSGLSFASQSSGSLPGEAFNTQGLGRVPFLTAPNVAPYNNDGSYNRLANGLVGVMNNLVGQVGLSNPVVGFDLNRSNSDANQIQSNMYAQVKPFSWLTFKSVYAIDYLFVENEIFQHPLSFEGAGAGGVASSSYDRTKRWVWTNTVQLNKTFAQSHNTSLLVGVEEQSTKNASFGLNRQTVNDPQFTNIQGGFTTPNAAGLGIGQNYLYSQFVSTNYNFERKYFLNANIRRDGASQLGTGRKYGTFYGISAAWDLSNESFWSKSKLSNVLSSFKLRGSYGRVGNIGGLGSFASLSTYGSGLYGGNATVVYNQAGNANLGWETSTKTDFGINFGLFKERLTGELTYYKNDINGLILNVPQAPSVGLPTTIPTNVGQMYNKGVEFSLSGLIVQKRDFSWRANFNITYNQNEVIALADGLASVVTATSGLESPSITLPGKSVGHLYVTRTAGVDPATGRRIFINAAGRQVYFQHIAPAGQFRWAYADGTEAPPVGAQDAVPYANALPKWVGGFDNTFRFKNFELNALFTYQFNYSIYFGSNAGQRDQRFWNNSVDILRAWQKPGEVTDIPKVVFGDATSNGSPFPIDVNVFNGDFVKLRTLTLAYNFPKALLDRVKLASARFFISGNNLAVFTKYPGPDPEVSSNGNSASSPGIDRNTIANARTVTIGLNIGF